MTYIVSTNSIAQPVISVDSSGNPVTGTGDASAANQAIQITAEQAILAKIIAAPATEAKQDSQITQETATAAVLGTTSGAAVVTDANGTIQQYLRGLIVKTLVLIGLFPASLGAKAAASSFAVTQSTEDAAQLGSLTEGAPVTDTASSGLNGRLQRVAQRITSLIALLPAALGSAAAAASLATTASTEDVARQGIITETVPLSDTASSGQNGRLQRIAQRLTSLIALIPTSLGAKAPNSSLAVAQAGYQYETVAASATNQAMGATGATGDYLSHVIIQPVTTAAGTVTILDNAITVFTFTTGTLADLRPIIVPIGAFSVSGAWKITTGTNVTAIGVGNFT